MIKKEAIVPERVRRIKGPFVWIPRDFITTGYLKMCSREELMLYFFLVSAGDRCGLSFYGDKRIGEMLGIDQNSLVQARSRLQELSLIEYQKPLYQVLSLPTI